MDIVDALAKHGPLCGTDLANRLGISLALLSHHWDVLVEAGLIKKKRVGQLRFCTLDPEKLAEVTSGWADAVTTPPASPKKKRTKAAAKR